MELYNVADDQNLRLLLYSPGVLLLQQIYQTRLTVNTDEFEGIEITINSLGYINNSVIELYNGKVIPSEKSNTNLNLPPYARNFSLLPGGADPIHNVENRNRSSKFFNLSVEFISVGDYTPEYGLFLKEKSVIEYYSRDPSVRRLNPPRSFLQSESTELLPVWSIVLLASGCAILILFAVMYEMRRRALIFECSWLLSEEDLCLVSTIDIKSDIAEGSIASGQRHSSIIELAETGNETSQLLRKKSSVGSYSSRSLQLATESKDNNSNSLIKQTEKNNCGLCYYRGSSCYWRKIMVHGFNPKLKESLKFLYALKESTSVSGGYFVNQFVGMTTTPLKQNMWILRLVMHMSLEDLCMTCSSIRINME